MNDLKVKGEDTCSHEPPFHDLKPKKALASRRQVVGNVQCIWSKRGAPQSLPCECGCNDQLASNQRHENN